MSMRHNGERGNLTKCLTTKVVLKRIDLPPVGK